MHARFVVRVEKTVDYLASTLFAAAAGYAAWVAIGAGTTAASLAEAFAAGGCAFLLSSRLLGAVQPGARKVPVPIFDVREVHPIETSEPSPAEPFATAEDEGETTLLLDDVLAELTPDSRVVRLFDPELMPTAGELKSRIDRHLDRTASLEQTADASQALHDALAELRRSIR